MKVFAVPLLCTLVGIAAGGSIAWPGSLQYSAPVAYTPHLLKTVIPGETKTTAYSTTQYINALPAASYSFGAPQFAVPVQHAAGFASLPGYFPVAGTPFAQATNIFYPAQPGLSGIFAPGVGLTPIAPAVPGAPTVPNNPFLGQPPTTSFQDEPSDQQSGDADSAVIESADSFSPEAQRQERPMSGESPSPQPPQAQGPLPQFPPMNTFPNFPAIPQAPQDSNPPQSPQNVPPQKLPQAPGYPQDSQTPQEPQNPQNPLQPQFPGLPQLPQLPSFPQFPQGSPLPSLPQIPGFPQFPSNLFPQNPQGPPQDPPSSFPASINNDDKGLNDEDTISVESA